jgi:orotate phosphoribosyltransferase
MGVLVAEELGLPFVYVRPEPKKHGAKKQVEGKLHPNSKVIVIEDLVSTGKSSLNAVRALRAEGANITSMIAIFSYDFEISKESFEKEHVELCTLSNYNTLIENALEIGMIKEENLELLKSWREQPDLWNGILI